MILKKDGRMINVNHARYITVEKAFDTEDSPWLLKFVFNGALDAEDYDFFTYSNKQEAYEALEHVAQLLVAKHVN